MTNLSDKVARVKELQANCYPDGVKDAQALGYAIFMFKQEADNMAALIAELWDENQKQREANKTRYDEGYNDGGNSRNHDFMDALSENTNFDADGDVGIDDICSYVKNLEQTIGQQREVLGMAREALESVLGAAMFDRPEIHRRIGKDALTAIDNVRKVGG